MESIGIDIAFALWLWYYLTWVLHPIFDSCIVGINNTIDHITDSDGCYWKHYITHVHCEFTFTWLTAVLGLWTVNIGTPLVFSFLVCLPISIYCYIDISIPIPISKRRCTGSFASHSNFPHPIIIILSSYFHPIIIISSSRYCHLCQKSSYHHHSKRPSDRPVFIIISSIDHFSSHRHNIITFYHHSNFHTILPSHFHIVSLLLLSSAQCDLLAAVICFPLLQTFLIHSIEIWSDVTFIIHLTSNWSDITFLIHPNWSDVTFIIHPLFSFIQLQIDQIYNISH